MSSKTRLCVDCLKEGITTKRKAPHPGPRCVSHHRAVRKARSNVSWASRIKATYDLTPEEYFKILDHQNGVCAICGVANGRTKRLSIDHDHASGYLRGLCCGPCNRGVLGHLRDSVEALQRAIDYLNDPPAVRVIGERVAPIETKRLA